VLNATTGSVWKELGALWETSCAHARIAAEYNLEYVSYEGCGRMRTTFYVLRTTSLSTSDHAEETTTTTTTTTTTSQTQNKAYMTTEQNTYNKGIHTKPKQNKNKIKTETITKQKRTPQQDKPAIRTTNTFTHRAKNNKKQNTFTLTKQGVHDNKTTLTKHKP
jgi:hypothetical protein